jgi:predicted glycogen debranching enzyme
MLLEEDTGIHQSAPPNAWNLQIGPDVCKDVQAGLNREWLVTNGLGGYASGSIVGATTRCYHGLLVAALRPPVERTVLVTKIDEEVTLPDGRLLKLGVNEYQPGVIDPHGYMYLEMVSLEGDIPCFTYQLTETLTLEKRIWMEYGQNTTYVQYSLRGVLHNEQRETPLTLTLFPFCLSRDYHSTTQGSPDWHFLVDNQVNRCRVRAFEGAPSYQMVANPSASFTTTDLWYWRVLHRRDSERGLADQEDVYQAGVFRIQLAPGMRTTLVLSAEAELAPELGSVRHEDYVDQSFSRHQRRIKQLLAEADRFTNDLQLRNPVEARLIVASDQFIVARPDYSKAEPVLQLSPDRKTIIAGYPWFTDWGRDSMISLPGLLLCTGRYSEARGLLKAFASFTHNGLIPNRFPDQGEAPEYNTADATLWMFRAIDNYSATTGDWTLVKELFATLSEIIEWHIRDTDYNIGVDPVDGLLHAGAPGVQLTWMDAKVGDWVVTPRRGKPVEINALWYYALTAMESWAVRLSIDATRYSQLRTQVRQHFATRFWYEAGGYLYDVVDVDGIAGQNDASLRPNQLFAASLTRDLLSDEQTASMLQQVTDHLLTPMGLRSLSPTDPAYRKHFNGPPLERDGAYHQGAVWPWLIGPYIDVRLRTRNDRAALRPLLQPLVQHLWDACLGTISEVAEPEPPFTPTGCFAQAWSVAELLRCWLLLGE